MNHKIISWNVGGLGEDVKITAIRNAVRRNNPSTVTIQETKKELVYDSLIRALLGNNGCDYVYLPSEGRSGGIIVMWNPVIVSKEEELLGDFSVTVKFRNINDNFIWLFTAVYGSSDSADYEQFWQELFDIRTILHEPGV